MKREFKTWRFLILSGIAALAPASVQAQSLDSLPPYKAERVVNGIIRNYGNEQMETMLRLWEAGFRKYQPNVRFNDNLTTSAAAIAGLYTRIADLGLMGREIWPIEIMGFSRVFHCIPLEVTVATGSFDVKDKSPAVAVFVHKDNPLTKLSMNQLDGIFGAMRTGGFTEGKWNPQVARTAHKDIRTWGQLGLDGDWAGKPIQTYGYDLQLSGTRFTFQRLVFKGGAKWNPNLREYAGADRMTAPDPKSRTRSGEQLIPELARDKYGIAYAGMQWSHPKVRPIAIAAEDGGPYVEPTKENCQNRTYPLIRDAYIYVYREPGKPLDAKLKEFLKYILSREGQQAVVEDHGFLPLTPQVVREQLGKLE